ncbi:MAG TPA: ribonuclease HI family protein [Myxococcales bacterium]|jgi:ribonuclease HI|nr:ribonuclease HI family protein [Myxococcales bacterium]
MASPTDAELLRFIAANEPLEATRRQHGDLDREALQALLERAAAALEAPVGPGLAANGPSDSGFFSTSSLPSGPGVAASNRIRVYSDGAARGNPGLAGAGAVLVEPNGRVVERLGKFLGVQTNNYAEYMGLLLGLKRAKDLGVQEVEVFADSELMIRQLGGRYQVKSPSLRPLYEEVLELLNQFGRFKLVHVPREMNAAADEMSNRAIDERM